MRNGLEQGVALLRCSLLLLVALWAMPAWSSPGPKFPCSASQPPDEAIANCTKDLKGKLNLDERVMALRIRANAYLRAKSYAQASADMDAALRLAPGDAKSLQERAAIYVVSKKYDQARADCGQIFQAEPNNWACLVLEGDIEIAQKDYPKAEKDYARAIASDPDKERGYLGRALALSRQGKYSLAIADDEALLKLQPDNVRAAVNLSYNHLQRYEAEDAIQFANRALQLDPKSSGAYEDRGKANFLMGNSAQAISDYQQAAQLSPKETTPHTGLARVYSAQHDYEKALAECDVAQGLNPESSYPSVMRAVIYGDMGDMDKAMTQANAAIAADKASGDAYRVRGNIEFARQQWANAADDYKKASELQPEGAYPAIWHFLAVARGGGDGKAELQAALAALTSADWPVPAGLMYIGKETPQQLLADANSTSDYRARELKCEANFYIGQLDLLAGRAAEAREDFRRSVETGVEGFLEFRQAKIELKNLP